ncbi:MAG: uridine kinase [Bacteroidales bacterium]|nr:uridine kinase [Bacteroidales bacterium]
MLVIGIAGGSGSGKTTVVKEIIKTIPKDTVAIISQDAYYYDNGGLSKEEKMNINFDHPDSIEWSLLINHVDKLKNGETIQMPIYSYLTCGRAHETIPVAPANVLIIEGILTLTQEELRNRMDIKVFVDADNDDRLMRIIKRDMMERGRSLDDVLVHYHDFVKPMHLQFIEPSKRYANVILPRGGKNQVGIDIISHRIKGHKSQSLSIG